MPETFLGTEETPYSLYAFMSRCSGSDTILSLPFQLFRKIMGKGLPTVTHRYTVICSVTKPEINHRHDNSRISHLIPIQHNPTHGSAIYLTCASKPNVGNASMLTGDVRRYDNRLYMQLFQCSLVPLPSPPRPD